MIDHPRHVDMQAITQPHTAHRQVGRPRRRLFGAVVLLVAGLTVVACGSGSGASATSSSSPASAAASGSNAAQTCPDSSKFGLKQAGTLTVGLVTSDEPISFIQNDKPVGMMVDLMGPVAQQLCLKVNYVSVPIGSIIEEVQNHQIDMSNFSEVESADRLAAVSFTTDTDDEGLIAVDRKGHEINPTNTAGDTIGAVINSITTSPGYFPAGTNMKTYPTKTAVYNALEEGAIDATFTGPGAAYEAAAQYSDFAVSTVLTFPTRSAWTVAKDHPALLAALNGALKTVVPKDYAGFFATWKLNGPYGISKRLLALYPGLKQVPGMQDFI